MFSNSPQGAWRCRDPLALTGELGAREIALTPDSAAGPWSEMAISGKLGFLGKSRPIWTFRTFRTIYERISASGDLDGPSNSTSIGRRGPH